MRVWRFFLDDFCRGIFSLFSNCRIFIFPPNLGGQFLMGYLAWFHHGWRFVLSVGLWTFM